MARSPAPGSIELNPEQRAAVRHREGPLLVIAGPGSGKTRVMTQRIAHLVAEGVPPRSILAITFTNKAAEEMVRRTRNYLSELHDASGVAPGDEPEVSTFHSFCARFLRRDIYRLAPYSVEYSIYDSNDQQSVVGTAIEQLELEKASFAPSACLSEISHMKNRLVTPDRAAELATTFRTEQIARIYQRYVELLAARNAVDFDDLLLLTLRILETEPEVRERRQRQHQFVMVDEFQDTNLPQYAIARWLAATHRNLCVTGDPDQSIYSWRGASPENFDRFRADFPEHRTVFLNCNYRSTPQIVAVAARLTGTAVGQRDLVSANAPGEAVQVLKLYDERDEARAVLATISEWHERRSTALGDMAVFYRVNSQSRVIEEELVRNGVPYRVVGGVAFYQRKEVKDVLAYLRAAAQPRDEVAVRRILNTPNRGLGKVSLERLDRMAWTRATPLGVLLEDDDALNELGRAAKALRELRAILHELRRARAKPIAEQLRLAIELCGYAAYMEKTEPETVSERMQNLDELLNAAFEVEDLATTVDRTADGQLIDPLALFLERVALASDADRYDNSGERLTLMTLHSAKGLEFDRVVITGVEESLLPHARNEEPESVEEERRLLYVGVTRARYEVRILHAQLRHRFGGATPTLPSRFLRDLDGEWLERLTPRGNNFGGGSSSFDSWTSSAASHEPFESTPTSAASEARRRRAPNSDPFAHYDDGDPGEPVEVEEFDGESFELGVWVEHEVLGRGEILGMSGHGRSRRVTVLFEDHGRKQLMPAREPLRIIATPDT
ncbi:MAG: ATP-dependent helicase [Planctomycetota bacterium]